MATLAHIAAAISSLAVRSLAYIFFRWIPGHPFPPAIYTFAVTYYASLCLSRAFDSNAGTQNSQQSVGHGPALDDKGRKTTKKSRDCRTWKSWLLGITSRGYLWNPIALSINALLVLLTLDAVYTGPLLYPSNDLSFARLGYISPNSASILVREPDASKGPLDLTYRMISPPGKWHSIGTTESLSNATDHTVPFVIKNLEPDTQYEYHLSNDHSGIFTTAPPIGHVPAHNATNPTFTFLTTSCIKPNFPYAPFSHRLNIPGLHHLSTLLPSLHAQFMLFLGDFIYIDVPHFHSASTANYRSEYRRVYASPSWPLVKNLPWLHVWDDHEISNDWDQGLRPPYAAARDPFDLYHHSVNPPSNGNATWYTFRAGPGSFFMLDTRSYRSPSAGFATNTTKTMLGAQQLDELLKWLHTPEPRGVRWKFVISSIPFTRNWRVNAMDTWGGYLVERKRVLEAMWEVPVHCSGTGVVILSGDRHEFAATRFPPPEEDGRDTEGGQNIDDNKKQKHYARTPVIEFSTSPLSMFYLPLRTYWSDSPSDHNTIGAEWGHDEMIKYIPDGNSKFAALDMEEALDVTQSAKMRFRLFVDGAERWRYEIEAPGVGGRNSGDE